jgi:NAD(P)-dependent dehydrogenase (short-subunit alcohol dehydrogenase family)
MTPKTVLITGASRGIGLEFARQCLARGDRVFAACRTPQSAHHLAALASDRLHIIPLDVADAASIAAAQRLVREQTDSLDVLINNAGILLDDEKIPDNLAALDFERTAQVFRVNATGALMVARAFLGMMRRGGIIASITSGYGSLTLHTHSHTYAYSASKAALNMFMRALAHDRLTRGMCVVVLDPGWVRTDMGTEYADLAPSESVGGMLRVIDSLKPADTGRFLRWDGAEMPW